MGIPWPKGSCQWEDISQEESHTCSNLLVMGILWIGGWGGEGLRSTSICLNGYFYG